MQPAGTSVGSLAVAVLLVACSDATADDGGGSTDAGPDRTDTGSSSGAGDDGDDTTGAPPDDTTGDPADTTAAIASSTDGSDDTGAAASTGDAPVDPIVLFPRSSILAEELAVIVNDDDPLSVQIAGSYVAARGIPEANVVHLAIPLTAILTPEQFGPLRDDAIAQLPDGIQALALTFTNPYRVDCMAITSAFAFGHGPGWCGGCGSTNPSPYYDSDSLAPFDDHGILPTMMLAATSIEYAEALVERGIASDGTHPPGDAWLVRTTDVARSVRWRQMQAAEAYWNAGSDLAVTYVDNSAGGGSNVVQDTADVMFYFTGLADVAGIETNTYRPGAIADHLTSFGGQVPDSSQMSALRWLEAGATASFGTVIEPCNHPQKFPHVAVVLDHYFRGQTLIEAYFKSVQWPGEGLFIGEPLARPWDGSSWEVIDGDLAITTTILIPGVDYDVEAADGPDGPWDHVLTGSIPSPQTLTIVIPDADRAYYRVRPQD